MSDPGTRDVVLVHHMGSKRLGLVGLLERVGGKRFRVYVKWPLHDVLVFNAQTGREHGRPRGPWRLSDEDVEAFCKVAGISKKTVKPLAPLRPRGGDGPIDKDSELDRKNRRRQLSLA
jgi:hypothetical protein